MVSDLDNVASFQNHNATKPTVCQTLHISTTLRKSVEGWATCLSHNEVQVIGAPCGRLEFCYLLLFETRARQRRLVSKIETKFRTF